MRAVRDHSRSLVEDPDRLDGVAALDLDETSFLRARTAPTRWITGLVALEGGPLLDVVADRTRATVDGWLGVRPDSWPDHIAMVALDPWRGYASALTAPLGHARVVVTTSMRPAGQHGGRAAHRSGTSAAAGWARRAVREQSRPRPARRRRGCAGCRSAVAALRVGVMMPRSTRRRSCWAVAPERSTSSSPDNSCMARMVGPSATLDRRPGGMLAASMQADALCFDWSVLNGGAIRAATAGSSW
jgi:hypothetical protein